MPTRSTLVLLHNETNQVLLHPRHELAGGEWGRDGQQQPPPEIQPGAVGEMGTDSAGLATGAEASVTYTIGSSGESVYLHWANPFSGATASHQNTGYHYDVFHTGGDGDNAIVHFFLRPAELRRAGDFRPSEDGFRFSNSFGQVPYSLPPLKGSELDLKYGNAADGLCGGMVFAALDYVEADVQIPQTTVAPSTEQDPLLGYFVERLIDTFDVASVSLLLKLMLPVYPDTDEGLADALALAKGRAYVMANIEWPMIRADIDAGRPSPVALCLVKSYLPTDLGKNHQVLVYAYEVHGHDVDMHVYDPNSPRDDTIRIRFSTRTTAEPIVVRHNVDVTDEDGVSQRPIYAFLRMNYTPKAPPGPHTPRRQVTLPDHVTIAVDQGTLERTTVETGRKLFPVMGGECGEIEADFERFLVKEQVVCTATPVGFADPRLTWMIDGREVPPGSGHRFTFEAWCLDYPDGEEQDVDPRLVQVTTSVDGTRLVIENTPGDGNYSFSITAVCREGASGDAVATGGHGTVAVGFGGKRLTVAGLESASAACIVRQLGELRTEPDLAKQIEEFLARVEAGLPPAEIHCPEELLAGPDFVDTSLLELTPERLTQIRTFEVVYRALREQDPDRALQIASDAELGLGLTQNALVPAEATEMTEA